MRELEKILNGELTLKQVKELYVEVVLGKSGSVNEAARKLKYSVRQMRNLEKTTKSMDLKEAFKRCKKKGKSKSEPKIKNKEIDSPVSVSPMERDYYYNLDYPRFPSIKHFQKWNKLDQLNKERSH